MAPAPLSDLLIDLLDAVLYFDKKRIVEASGVQLHPSETHMLMRAVQGLSFTGIARQFGVSKGAVSQVFARLAAKGVLTVEKDRANRNAAQVVLTPLGEELRREIEAMRTRLAVALEERLARYSEDDLDVVRRFLGDVQVFVEGSLLGEG